MPRPSSVHGSVVRRTGIVSRMAMNGDLVTSGGVTVNRMQSWARHENPETKKGERANLYR
jgi:hypothetical protein